MADVIGGRGEDEVRPPGKAWSVYQRLQSLRVTIFVTLVVFSAVVLLLLSLR